MWMLSLVELKSLIRSGRASRSVSLSGRFNGGDCSAIAAALMADLAAAGELQHEWHHLAGECRGIGQASLD
jgi:hypothetical protein